MFAIRLRTEEDTSLVLHTAYFHKGQEIGVQNGNNFNFIKIISLIIIFFV